MILTSPKLVLAITAVLVASGVPQIASAQTVTFNGHTNTIFGDENTGNGFATAISDGYDFVSSVDHFHFVDGSFYDFPSNGTSSLLEDRNGFITMTLSGGGLFNFYGLQAYGTTQSGYTAATSLTVTGFFGGGGTISSTFVGLTTSAFSDILLAGFYGLSSIQFDGTDGDGFGLENLAVSAVPEPATMTLLATGLVGMVGAGMRRRKKA